MGRKDERNGVAVVKKAVAEKPKSKKGKKNNVNKLEEFLEPRSLRTNMAKRVRYWCVCLKWPRRPFRLTRGWNI